MIRAQMAALACTLVIGAAGAAAADGALTAVYVFSWAGMDVGELRAEVVETGEGYRTVWSGRTTGLIGTLFPFTSSGAAQGRRAGARYLPDAYDGQSRWRDGGGAWRVEFGQDGRASAVQVPPADLVDREPVPAALRQGPDPASLALMAIAAAGPGARLAAVSFDGKRAVGFDLACAATIVATDGELACSVESRLLAGASRQWRERQPEPDQRLPVRVWLRPSVAVDEFWPVRVEAPSRFGTIAARLTSLEKRAPTAG